MGWFKREPKPPRHWLVACPGAGTEVVLAHRYYQVDGCLEFYNDNTRPHRVISYAQHAWDTVVPEENE